MRITLYGKAEEAITKLCNELDIKPSEAIVLLLKENNQKAHIEEAKDNIHDRHTDEINN